MASADGNRAKTIGWLNELNFPQPQQHQQQQSDFSPGQPVATTQYLRSATTAQAGAIIALTSNQRQLRRGSDGERPQERQQQSIIGRTALHLVAMHNYPGLCRMLVEHGADIDAVEESGRTPLHVAALLGHGDIVEPLLAAGADVNARDFRGATPLFLAVSNGHEDVVRVLLDSGADCNIRIEDL